jgi:hypothetical protein
MLTRRAGLLSHGQTLPETPDHAWYSDMVDVNTVDLSKDEYVEGDADRADDEQRNKRIKGKTGHIWRLYNWIA